MKKDDPIVIEKLYHASIARVWKALITPDEIKNWFLEMPDFKAEVNHVFTFVGGPPDKPYLHLCKVMEVINGRKLSYTWRYEGYEGDSLVTFELFEQGKDTKIILTHEGLHTFPESNPDLAKGNFVQGWTDIIGTLLKGVVEK